MSKHRLWVSILITATVTLIGTVTTAAERIKIKPATAVAIESLDTMRQLIEIQKNYREMGFESADELKRIKLGVPFEHYMVRLDELGEYDGKGAPGALLHPTSRATFPVMIDGSVKSSITVANKGDGLMAVAFGNSNKISLLVAARKAGASISQKAEPEHFLVDIPSMKLFFDGYYVNGELMLVSVLDDESFDLKAGEAMPAIEVFRRVAPAARRHTGMPG